MFGVRSAKARAITGGSSGAIDKINWKHGRLQSTR